ncbi:GNAT family N-acetyltransferase [Myxococcaceae bacterium GXIMD 01537]
MVEVREAGPIPACAAVLASAFAREPGMCWVCGPGVVSKQHWFETTLAMLHTLPGARRYSAVRGEEVLAVAIVSPPQEVPSLSRQLSWLASTGLACGVGCVQRTLRYLRASERLKPAGSWTLEFIGVADSARGQGLSRSLVARIERDLKDAPLFLTTADPRNVPLYQHLGFSGVGTLTLDALSVTAMGLQRSGPGAGG